MKVTLQLWPYETCKEIFLLNRLSQYAAYMLLFFLTLVLVLSRLTIIITGQFLSFIDIIIKNLSR